MLVVLGWLLEPQLAGSAGQYCPPADWLDSGMGAIENGLSSPWTDCLPSPNASTHTYLQAPAILAWGQLGFSGPGLLLPAKRAVMAWWYGSLVMGLVGDGSEPGRT